MASRLRARQVAQLVVRTRRRSRRRRCRATLRRAARAPHRRRTARLSHRSQGLLAFRTPGHARYARSAPGNRTPRRTRPRASARAKTPSASPTSAPAAARSRWRSPTNVRARRSSPSTTAPPRSKSREANARALRLTNVEFRHGHWCEPLGEGLFDLIASNPPYIALGDLHLDATCATSRRRRCRRATMGSTRSATSCALRPRTSSPAAGIAGRTRRDQGDAVRALFVDAGLIDIDTGVDMERRERVTSGIKPGGPSLG